jgi:hypothetical protein
MTSEEEIAAIKEATRVAHEAIKDLKGLIKEAKQISEHISVQMHEEVDEKLQAEVKVGLEQLSVAFKAATEEATNKVFKRFDDLADLLLGEDWRSKKKGKPSIPDLIESRLGRGEGREI